MRTILLESELGGVFFREWNIHIGIIQGCLLSPLLCSLIIELLACMFCNRAEEWGITLAHEPHIISLYADDALLYLHDRMINLPGIMELLSVYGDVSWLRVN